jgi:hypothetical protein
MVKSARLIIILAFSPCLLINGGIYNSEAEIRIPGNFAQISSQKALIDSTTSPNVSSRFNAVLRLIQIGDSTAVPALIDLYKKSPSRQSFIDDNKGIEYWSLYAIGKLGGAEARKFLWDVAEKLLKPEIIYRPAAGDTLFRFQGLFEALSMAERKDKDKYFLQIFNNDTTNSIIRMQAYETYLRLHLKDARYADLHSKIYYLLDEMRPIKNIDNYIRPGVQSSAFIKKDALKEAVIELAISNPDILASYQRDLPPYDPFVKEIRKIIEITYSRIGIISNP